MISHTDRRRKRSDLCAICEKRPPVCRINPKRNPFSRTGMKGLRVTLKHHDVCGQCWKTLMGKLKVAQSLRGRRDGA